MISGTWYRWAHNSQCCSHWVQDHCLKNYNNGLPKGVDIYPCTALTLKNMYNHFYSWFTSFWVGFVDTIFPISNILCLWNYQIKGNSETNSPYTFQQNNNISVDLQFSPKSDVTVSNSSYDTPVPHRVMVNSHVTIITMHDCDFSCMLSTIYINNDKFIML